VELRLLPAALEEARYPREELEEVHRQRGLLEEVQNPTKVEAEGVQEAHLLWEEEEEAARTLGEGEGEALIQFQRIPRFRVVLQVRLGCDDASFSSSFSFRLQREEHHLVEAKQVVAPLFLCWATPAAEVHLSSSGRLMICGVRPSFLY